MAKVHAIFFVISMVFLSVVVTENLQLGNPANATLAYVENVRLSGIPFKSRTKNVFYNDENIVPKVIKAISAIDLVVSKAKVTVTAGGIGSSFVLRAKQAQG